MTIYKTVNISYRTYLLLPIAKKTFIDERNEFDSIDEISNHKIMHRALRYFILNGIYSDEYYKVMNMKLK